MASHPQPGNRDVLPEGAAPHTPPSTARGPAVLSAALAVGLLWLVILGWRAEPTVLWSSVTPPPGPLHVASLVATPDGFAVLSGLQRDGVTLWFSPDGIEWSASRVEGAPSSLVVDGSDLLAFDGSSAVRLARQGQGWEATTRIALPQPMRIGYGTSRPGLVSGRGGFVAQAISGDVLWSPDGAGFRVVVEAPGWGEGTGMPDRRRCAPPASSSLEMPPLLEVPDGFLALISPVDPFGVWPVCEPEVWVSADGVDWHRAAAGSPMGERAFVYDIAHHGGRFVAVGGTGFDQPALWTSSDGLGWERQESAPTRGPYELREVEAGEVGWVVLGEPADGTGLVGWVSPDARCWTPLPDHVHGREAAVGADRFLVAERRSLPGLWLGTASGSWPGVCR